MRTAYLQTLIIALSCPLAALAAPVNVGKEQLAFEEVGLEPDAALGGRSATLTGEALAEPRYYYVPAIDVMSPTVISVLAEDPGQPVKVTLHRHYWNRPDLEGETDASGGWSFTGRIDDSIGIAISADAPAGFVILFWSGEPVPPEVPPILFDGGRPVEAVGGE
ncbi:MAG: hypothetical protein AAFY59_14850 [Pseudomonadota bacterium]